MTMRLAALILALAAPVHAAQVSPLDAIADDLEANDMAQRCDVVAEKLRDDI